MKNLLQNITNANTNNSNNNNGAQTKTNLKTIRNLKRKRNCSGKENIDPAPPNLFYKKDLIPLDKFIHAKQANDVATDTNNNISQVKSMFNALVEVAQLEHDFLRVQQEETLSSDELNTTARELFLIDPFLNDVFESVKLMPTRIQVLVSEFHELDAEETIKNHQLKMIESVFKKERQVTLLSSYSHEQLLSKLQIVLMQRQIIGDRKVAKSIQIKEMIQSYFHHLGIDDHEDDETKPQPLNEELIINKFKTKLKNSQQQTKRPNKKFKKEMEKDLYDKELSSDEAETTNTEGDSSTSSSFSSSSSDDLSSTTSDENSKKQASDKRYCLCKKDSYGKMVLCDNKLCKIGWFHFDCVNLKAKPKGKWFCNKCKEKKLKKK